jgi:hypothetical protein
MALKPHSTEPDKMIFVKTEYNLPKQWQGLTDEEILAFVVHKEDRSLLRFARLIEEALREKNS